MQVLKLLLNHCKWLSRQVTAAAPQVYKCHLCRNETRPCIRHLFSHPNRTFRSSNTETLGFFTYERRIKVQILVHLKSCFDKRKQCKLLFI